jgi:6-phosphogluconolactonase
VEVVEDDHQRAGGGHGPEPGADGVEEPEAHLLRSGVARRLGQVETRRPQDLDPRPEGGGAEPLPADGPQQVGAAVAGRRPERLEQRRLAHAGVARHQHEPPVAGQRGGEGPLEGGHRLLPADQLHGRPTLRRQVRPGNDAGVSDIDVEILPDGAALAGRAADLVVGKLAQAVDARGRATLAVSGGNTPAAFLAELAQRKLPWEAVHVFQVDERVAPPDDPERNLTGLRQALLDRVPIPPGNLHPMPVNDPDLGAGAAAYGDEIRAVTGPQGRLDVVHLGLGDDGHAASWPPGDPVVDAADDPGGWGVSPRQRWREPPEVAVVGPFNGHLRMTLTPPVVNRAGWIVWLITGAAKAAVIARLLAGDPALPASRVRRHDVTLLADAAAGGAVTRG